MYVWRLVFLLAVDNVEPTMLAELELALRRSFTARVVVEGPELRVRMRVVGHVEPASAVGEAAQMLRVPAAKVGLTGDGIRFVSAERIAASPVT